MKTEVYVRAYTKPKDMNDKKLHHNEHYARPNRILVFDTPAFEDETFVAR